MIHFLCFIWSVPPMFLKASPVDATQIKPSFMTLVFMKIIFYSQQILEKHICMAHLNLVKLTFKRIWMPVPSTLTQPAPPAPPSCWETWIQRGLATCKWALDRCPFIHVPAKNRPSNRGKQHKQEYKEGPCHRGSFLIVGFEYPPNNPKLSVQLYNS